MSCFVIHYPLSCDYMSCGLGLIRYAALYVVAALEIQSPSLPPPLSVNPGKPDRQSSYHYDLRNRQLRGPGSTLSSLVERVRG